MKTAVWLYLFLFIAFFDLHAQYPILTPFAISLGAAPSFIGLMMGIYSFTHLPGNIIAGFSVDRYGSRIFIVLSLAGAGVIMLLQGMATNPWQLLALRSVSGFVLAFLSPACLALLARLAKDHIHQGKLMAGNGLVHTLASVVSPAAGAYLVAKIGFFHAFTALGYVLIGIALLAVFFIHDSPSPAPSSTTNAEETAMPAGGAAIAEQNVTKIPWRFFLLPIAISCSQGILFFELPLMQIALESIMTTGILFSIVSFGALVTLSLLFLNRYSSYFRTWFGCLALAICFFTIAVGWPIPLTAILLVIGMAKGIVFPALSTLLIELSGGTRYGRMFSGLAIAMSVGSFLGPMLAGQLRDFVSSYYIAFIVLMLGLCFLPGQPASRTTAFVPGNKNGNPVHS
ncbi:MULTISPECIES: MFS transporter [unclassified Paenibacillus]|uniref:MFS transporter n=1 Tax=unclassified Paenibacillus TaxID=185978 RepID=UPI001C10B0C2|nr:MULTISPECIES: MFS transporter [unclassified Paenibacillus]MBU5441450.1 MFS transporter [Paenibacillus sp. MSJ-34]CAH0118319.1 Multidrug resistance protein MdtG [Paenibacillus sp. CECT 9249]